MAASITVGENQAKTRVNQGPSPSLCQASNLINNPAEIGSPRYK